MDIIVGTRKVGGVTIVDISGRIVLGEESAALRELVCDLLSKGHRKILFNLGDVNYIDSSGLGHLVRAFTSVRKQGGELKLLNLTSDVQNVMQMTRSFTPSSTSWTMRSQRLRLLVDRQRQADDC
jgi:anti-sigma B factor antagonist